MDTKISENARSEYTMDKQTKTLTGRIRQLAERYATPLPKLTDEVATLASRVEEHLIKMGFKP